MPDEPLAHSDPIEEATATTEIHQFPCGQCGAKLSFAPGVDALKCEYCGYENEIEQEATAIQELDFRDYLSQLAEGSDLEEVATVKCGHCGADLDRPPNLDSFRCPYCASNIVASESSPRLIKPKSLLPFHIPRKDAREKFRGWIKGLWFAPNDLKSYARSDSRLTGVYVPYWTYDCDTTSHYTGMRGEDYYTTETYTTTVNGKTVTRTRTVRRTRWYSASGTVQNRFNDILILASRSLPKKHAQKLEPWDLNHLEPYQDEFLAGFRAERYQVQLDEGFGEATPIMETVIRQAVRMDIGGDRQIIHSLSIRHDNITFKHILLPVWISAYRYRDRVFRILINARTGEVQGERPWSIWKIVGAVLGGLATIALIWLIAQWKGWGW